MKPQGFGQQVLPPPLHLSCALIDWCSKCLLRIANPTMTQHNATPPPSERSSQECSNPAGHTDGVTSAVFSKDSKWAVTMSYDHTARLWDTRDGSCLGVMQHGGAVTRAQFSEDGSLIVTASADNVATLWRCNQARKPVPVHSLKVRLGFSGRGYSRPCSLICCAPQGLF